MTSECKATAQWRHSGTERLQLSRKYLADCFLGGKKNMLIHFNQFFGPSNDLAQINNE